MDASAKADSTREAFGSVPEYINCTPYNPIAIIGINARFPGASSLEAHWDNLDNCRDMVRKTPADRWDWRKYHGDPQSGDYTLVSEAAFIDDVDKFDARFFGISPREAKLVDPHQRLLLESGWHCLEDAGYRAADLAGSDTGVFMAFRKSDYEELVFRNRLPVEPSTGTGLEACIVANRISYFLDFTGPSIAIHTACSGSLIALHLAIQSIHAGDCGMALVGGVSLMLTPTLTVAFDKAGLLSRDCRSKAFDASANGYGRGEGLVTILVKDLAQAEQDGDNIYAVVRGSATTHSGRTKSLTAPSAPAQSALIKKAIRRAGVDPRTITYLEAHGTGTPRGDSIEFKGIRAAFAEMDAERHEAAPALHRCAIGSVKTNIGHLEAAAGLASVVKVVLAMKYGRLPGNPHLSQVSPYCNTEGTPFYFPSQSETWARIWNSDGTAIPRRAGVSAYGFGGSSVHCVLEEYAGDRAVRQEPAASVLPVLLLSAQDDAALARYTKQFLEFVSRQEKPAGAAHGGRAAVPDGTTVDELLYTFQVGRNAMNSRSVIMGRSWGALASGLRSAIESGGSGKVFGAGNAQSSQDKLWQQAVGMARDWVAGGAVELADCYAGVPCRRVPALGYPFARTRFWFMEEHSKQLEAASPEPETGSRAVAASRPLPSGKETVEFSVIDGHIAVIRLNAAARSNMFDAAMIDEMRARVEQIEVDANIRVAVIAANSRTFCMGGPLSWLLEIAKGVRSFKDHPFLYRGFLSSRVPVISALEGHAFGGGFLLGLYADIPILAQEALYSANFMKFGFTPGMGATVLLRERLGTAVANEMMLTAAVYSGEQLKNRGAGVAIVKQADVMSRAIAIAKGMASMPVRSVRALKQHLSRDLLERIERQIDREEQLHREVVTGPEVTGLLEAQIALLADGNSAADTQPATTAPFSVDDSDALTDAASNQFSETSAARAAGGQLERICAVVASVLHLERTDFGADTPLKELGFDSVNAIELADALEKQLGVKVSGADLADVPDCRHLAGAVAGSRPDNHGPNFASAPDDAVLRSAGTATDSFGGKVTLAPLTGAPPMAEVPAIGAPLASVAGRSAAPDRVERICTIVARVLQLERGDFGADTPLKELGFDSVNAIELADALEKQLGVKVSGSDLADVPDCRHLAGAVAGSRHDNHGPNSASAPDDAALPSAGTATGSSGGKVTLAPLTEAPPMAEVPAIGAPLASVAGRSAAPDQVERICTIVARVLHLGRADFGADTPLKELGFDSVNAIELADALEKQLGVKVSGADLADVADCRQLAAEIGKDGGRKENAGRLDDLVDAVAAGQLSIELALERLTPERASQ